LHVLVSLPGSSTALLPVLSDVPLVLRWLQKWNAKIRSALHEVIRSDEQEEQEDQRQAQQRQDARDAKALAAAGGASPAKSGDGS